MTVQSREPTFKSTIIDQRWHLDGLSVRQSRRRAVNKNYGTVWHGAVVCNVCRSQLQGYSSGLPGFSASVWGEYDNSWNVQKQHSIRADIYEDCESATREQEKRLTLFSVSVWHEASLVMVPPSTTLCQVVSNSFRGGSEAHSTLFSVSVWHEATLVATPR